MKVKIVDVTMALALAMGLMVAAASDVAAQTPVDSVGIGTPGSDRLVWNAK